uniref:Polysaccharide chain length determinant N-terminal domain-containing protein n=1 Tax=mine drainage metagenome TaxID=410659 RepID=E6PN29_9ZZZZ
MPTITTSPDDEIDLVELGVGIWRKRTLIIGIALVCVALGLAFALIKPKDYEYTAVIQLGSYPDHRGQPLQVISADAAVGTLRGAILPALISQYAQQHKLDPKTLKIDATKGVGGGDNSIVTLSGKGPQNAQDAFFAIEKMAATQLTRITAGKTDAALGNATMEYEQAKIKLQEIQDPNQIQSEKSKLKETVLAAQGKLAGLKQQTEVLKKKTGALLKTQTLYQGLAKNLEGYLAKAQEASIHATDAKDATHAMTAMLLNTQIQQDMQQLNAIQQKLTLEIPQKLADAQADLAENLKQQQVQELAISKANFDLENFDAHLANKIQNQNASIAGSQAQLQALTPTRLLADPTRSDEPIGISRTVIVMLSGVLGVFLGLFFALLSGYVAAVRQRIAATPGAATATNKQQAVL